jgi:glycosidase
MMDGGDGLWFKDAIIYQLHVKSFFDDDDDGIGDFAGLARKVEYIKTLGATCVWLLPFYPSPTTVTSTRRTERCANSASSCASRTRAASAS